MSEPFDYEKGGPFESFDNRHRIEQKAKVDAATEKVKRAAKSFAAALDSTSPGLTKQLLDIFKNLKQVGGVEETVLWGMSFKLLYEKNRDKMPEKLKNILEEMLVNLSQYESVKQKSESLEDLLRACAFINTSPESSDPKFSSRTFMPENFGV